MDVNLHVAAQLWNKSPISEDAIWEQTDSPLQVWGVEEKQNHT